MRHFPAAVAVLGLAGLMALAGCSDDREGPVADDDLPASVVESDSHRAGIPTVSSCEALTTAQERLTTSADVDDGYRYWTYDLEDGTWLGVAVVEPDAPFRTVSDALASVWREVDGCPDEAPLGSLPGGAIGFTSTGDEGDPTGATLLAPVGEDRIVTIAVSTPAGAEPTIDPVDLLAAIEHRAAEVDLE